MPQVFYGVASLNSNPAPVETSVKAYISGALAGSATTIDGGSYTVVVTGAVGDIVNFEICTLSTAETGTFSEYGGKTNLNLSASGSCTTTDTDNDGGGGGGGGGGSAVPTSGLNTSSSSKESHFYDVINASGKAIFAIANTKLAFTNIEFNANANQTVNNARITISVLNSLPSYISSLKNVYQYLLVETENLDNNVENIEISFRVLKSWLSNNNYDKDNVALIRYYDGWTTLPTTLVSEDDEYVYYKAQSPAFLIFAIKVLEIVEKPALPGGDNATPPMPPPLPAVPEANGGNGTTSTIWEQIRTNVKSAILIGIILLIIILLVVIILPRLKKSKKLKE